MNFDYLAENKINTVIFDFDGTLYNKKKIKYYFFKAEFFRLRYLLTFLKLRSSVLGIDFSNKENFRDNIISNMSKKLKCSENKAKNFIDEFMIKFIKILHKHYKAEKTVIDFFNTIDIKNYNIVCFSDYSNVKERIEAIGMDTSYFDLFVSSEDYGALKPCARPFTDICKQLNVAPTNVLMVGDRIDTDGEGAKRVNMNFLQYPIEFKSTFKL